jgi:hypothetical protein
MMARIPRPNEDCPHESDETGERDTLLLDESPVQVTADIEKHIGEADYWARDWQLRELEFEPSARRAEHEKYMAALHKVCRDYNNQILKEFPLGVARWLAQEAENVCDGLPSQVLKRPTECVQTANIVHENQFRLIWDEWEKQNQNPAIILQALSKAKELGVLPPDWVLNLLIDAGARVYESDGGVKFDEALGFTPKKIKQARSAQKKVWVADLVAEAVDAGLSHTEAKELAIFEAELVYGWHQYTPDTVQKYYEQHVDERDGFGRSFMYSFGWYGLSGDNIYHAIRLPYWRKKVLKLRLEAYREAIELFPDTDNREIDRAQRLPHVVAKTVDALRRNEPPKSRFGHYSELEF